MKAKVLVAFGVLLALGYAYYYIDEAREVIRVHATDPDAKSKVGKVYMRQIDILCRIMLPKLKSAPTALQKALICDHYGKLVPAIFTIAALTGWCASVWLLAFQGNRQALASWLMFSVSFLLAFVAGIICYLVLIAPFAAFGVGNPRLESAAAFPLLAGLFLRAFFDRLPDVLRGYLDKISGKGGGTRTHSIIWFFALTVCVGLRTEAHAQLTYWRCADPKDICTAFTEQDQSDCPECRKWQEYVLELQELNVSARTQQKRFGVESKGVASNFYLAAALRELYGADITQGGRRPPPKAIDVYNEPTRYNLAVVPENDAQPGTIVLIGDLAGVIVEVNGERKVAYPSASTRQLNFETAKTLANAQKASVKYVVPEQPDGRR